MTPVNVPTLLSQPGCYNCKMVERKLDELGVVYETVNVREDEGWLGWLSSENIMSTPVLVNRDQYVLGFDPDGIVGLVS